MIGGCELGAGMDECELVAGVVGMVYVFRRFGLVWYRTLYIGAGVGAV